VSYKQRSETTGQVCVQSVRLNSPWYTRRRMRHCLTAVSITRWWSSQWRHV